MNYLTFVLCNHFQLYVAAVSPARDEKATYVAWGHSTVINPWYVLLPLVKTVLFLKALPKSGICPRSTLRSNSATKMEIRNLQNLQSDDVAKTKFGKLWGWITYSENSPFLFRDFIKDQALGKLIAVNMTLPSCL